MTDTTPTTMQGRRITLPLLPYAFAALALSGAWKSFIDAFSAQIPDITIAFALVVFACLAIRVAGKGLTILAQGRAPLLAISALLVWAIFTSAYTASAQTYIVKLISLALCVAIFLIPLTDTTRYQHYLRAFLHLSAVTSLAFVLIFPRIFASRSSYDNSIISVYLQAGYIAGLSLLLNVRSLTGFGKARTLLLSALYILCLGMSGARGPILFAVAAPIMARLPLFLLGRTATVSRSTIRTMVAAIAITAGLAIFVFMLQNDVVQSLLDRTVARFAALAGDNQVASLDEREQFALFSIDMILKSPVQLMFGSGIASFGQLYYGQDIKIHPHNVALEVWIECGLVGLITYCFFALNLLRSYWRRRDAVALAAYAYLTLNSLKSFSLADSRIMFGVLAILLVRAVANDRKNQEVRSHSREVVEITRSVHS